MSSASRRGKHPILTLCSGYGAMSAKSPVDPIILGELRFGILLLRRGRKRTNLQRWFDLGVQRLHCLPWDAATGLRWAQLLAELRAAGRAMPIKDSVIGATALANGLAVVIRNRSDFEKTGVTIMDPFQ